MVRTDQLIRDILTEKITLQPRGLLACTLAFLLSSLFYCLEPGREIHNNLERNSQTLSLHY